MIVGGGDGTLNLALSGIGGDRALPLGILPLGTANNLARTSGNSGRPGGRGCEVAATRRRRRIDLGWVNGRYFFTTASIGLSVRIAEELSADEQAALGASRVRPDGNAGAASARVPSMRRISWPSGKRHTRTVQIVIGNGRYYGAALRWRRTRP